jgi:ATP synthase F0 subunit c
MEFFANVKLTDYYSLAAALAAGLAMGLGAIGTAMGMGTAAGKACEAIHRQPAVAQRVTKTMLIGQAVTETPAIFCLIIAILMLFGAAPQTGSEWGFLGIIGVGLCMGFGAIGSGWGEGLPVAKACEGIARQPENEGLLIRLMLIGQAMAEASAIFALVLALTILFTVDFAHLSFTGGIACISAGLCMGLGAIGTGFGLGVAAQGAIHGVSRYPKTFTLVLKTMLVGQAVAESCAIFALVVAFMILMQFAK